MKITAEMLEAKGACDPQVSSFRELWPNGVTPSLQAAAKAAEAGLSLNWFAREFLPPKLLAEYEKACTAALAKYEKARDAAWAEYDKACAAARAEYAKACAAARAKYDKAHAPALWRVGQKAMRAKARKRVRK